MCPDCTRIASDNARLQRIKHAADSLIGALHIRYTFDKTDLSRLLKKELDAYEMAINESQVK